MTSVCGDISVRDVSHLLREIMGAVTAAPEQAHSPAVMDNKPLVMSRSLSNRDCISQTVKFRKEHYFLLSSVLSLSTSMADKM